jgi:hypothetical protein
MSINWVYCWIGQSGLHNESIVFDDPISKLDFGFGFPIKKISIQSSYNNQNYITIFINLRPTLEPRKVMLIVFIEFGGS